MGNGSNSKVSEEERRRNHKIDKMIAENKRQLSNQFKLLLLGTGDSGKSTIVKQMRILHANGFDPEEIAAQQSVITSNILASILAIAKAMEEFGVEFENADREEEEQMEWSITASKGFPLTHLLHADAMHIRSLEKGWTPGLKLDAGDWACLKRLWQDGGLQTCFLRANEFQVADSTQYFCDQIDRYASPDFVPSEQDMLRSRVATVGIVEFDFSLRGLTCKIIDVGGQRSQRKKWIHCFENVNALMFVAAMSEYNQVLVEESKMNRMHESLKLFNTVINCQWFRKASIVLFLNKKDLFEEKLKRYPLSAVFPEYKGGADYAAATRFIEQRFDMQKNDQNKMVYAHRTCATDTKNVEFVLEACFDILMTKNLACTGLEV